ncbi:hypothetical protein CR194_04990 [Salipaludibacillus keqinensis]|uniref:Uncharacterized protein n=1 Tax=Salipaludibacillus keqinensis TaxID=2045207 RepID=A0A323TQU6_9BACI|nr:sigma-70 family RNA polymerase sigma factor [Salipaludibacillus keqinensis]PYZ94883.1 hypothetical protein CR194_04990 [Salipaludibacillus keqinensis]
MEQLEINQEEEFEQICEQFMPMIYGLIRKWKLAGDKDEFIQTGRIALYDAWTNYDGDRGAFAAYAKSYIYGRFQLTLERKNRWQTRHVSTEPIILSETNPAVVLNEEDLFILRDLIARSRLTPREQDWINGALIDGLKLGEIADRHGVAISTVRSWRKEALKKLRERMVEFV